MDETGAGLGGDETAGGPGGQGGGKTRDRPRFFDDLAGVAGGAFSALTGLREEAETVIRARLDDAIRRLDLVRREELEAVQDLAANARAGQEAAETRLRAMEARLAALELGLETTRGQGVGAGADAPAADAAGEPSAEGTP